MKVDLGFTGNQLTVINTVFTVGYVMYCSPPFHFPSAPTYLHAPQTDISKVDKSPQT